MNYAQALDFFEYKDGELYWKKSPAHRVKVGSKVGWSDDYGYKAFTFHYKKQKVHRIIFLLHYGYLPQEVDHIDGNPKNNHIDNLRAATRAEQLANTKIRKDNSSGLKGICWDKSKEKWLVRVNKQNKVIYQGRFDDLELASLVAIEARNKYHGLFAKH